MSQIKEILKRDIALFTAIPPATGASRVDTIAGTTQNSWGGAAASQYVLLIESSPEFRLATDDAGYGLII